MLNLTIDNDFNPIFTDGVTIYSSADGFKLFRAEHGLSTRRLAEICSVSPRTVEGWEQGRPVGDIRIVFRINAHFGGSYVSSN